MKTYFCHMYWPTGQQNFNIINVSTPGFKINFVKFTTHMSTEIDFYHRSKSFKLHAKYDVMFNNALFILTVSYITQYQNKNKRQRGYKM